MYLKPFFTLIAAAILFGSCSFDYDQAQVAEDLSEKIPNSIIRNYTYVDVRPRSSSLIIYSREAKLFHTSRRTELTEVFFQEIDTEGKIVTEGEADRAVIDTRNDNVELYGSIRFAGARQETEIIAEYLFWNNESRILEGKRDEEVVLTQSDGTQIRGKGFSIDTPSKTIDFSSPVEGTYVYSEDEDE